MELHAVARFAAPFKEVGVGKRDQRGVKRPRQLQIRAENTGGSRPGEKIEKWLKSPFDFAAFGPRATVGAVTTAPEKIAQLQDDLMKLSELLQDPRSPQEKQEILLEEMESRLAECVREGAMFEADVLDNLKTALPDQVAELIPQPEIFSREEVAPLPEPLQAEPIVTYSSESVSAEQTSAVVTGVEEGIVAVEDALSALRSNESSSRENMLKLNLKEARNRLGNLLEEVTTTSAASETTLKARTVISEADAEL